MKRLSILLVMVLACVELLALFDGCNCNDLFDKDIKSKHATFNSQNAKEVLYKYFTSDQEIRSQMQSDASMEASLAAVVKAIPVDIGFGSSSSSTSNRFLNVYRESIENKFLPSCKTKAKLTV